MGRPACEIRDPSAFIGVIFKVPPVCLTQELADELRTCTLEACPQVLQQSNVCDYLTECVSQCCKQAHSFIRSTLLKDAGQKIGSMLR